MNTLKVYALRHPEMKMLYGICPCVETYESMSSNEMITLEDYDKKWDLVLISNNPFISKDKHWLELFLNGQVYFGNKLLHLMVYAKEEIEIVELELRCELEIRK